MSRMNVLVLFIILISISTITTETVVNTSLTTMASMLTKTCTHCQTMACRCSSVQNTLNCSSYLLNLTYASNCAETIVWEIVDFSSRNLESLHSTQLLSLRMRRLLLKSNLISKIHDHTFDSIADILTELDLQMNQLSTISSQWFNSKLTQLKIFNFASNQLISLVDLDNIHLSQLQELNLSCNQIQIFPKQIQQWTSLIKLDLSSNRLSSIPRFALTDLSNLTWLSLAANRNLSCIIQDSFKYLKVLKYLDLSSTNLFDLDGCIFIQLSSLRILKIERVSINCSSCWLPIAKKNSIKLFGQCFINKTIQRLDALTNKQLHSSCLKSSIDCSSDYCEPDFINPNSKSLSSAKLSIRTKQSSTSKNLTINIVLGIIFSLIGLVIIIVVIIFIYRWKQGKRLLCCDLLPTTTTRRQRQKHMIDSNSMAIDSVVTHGTNMDVSPYSHYDDIDPNAAISNNKRKLYNPMFINSSQADKHYPQSSIALNENRFHNKQLYSQNL